MFFKRAAKNKSEPGGAKSSEQQSSEQQSVEQKPTEQKPSEERPVETATANSKPAEPQPAAGVSQEPPPPPNAAPGKAAPQISRESSLAALVRPAPLPATLLRRATSPEALGFKTTADLKPYSGLPGQEQALMAISAGARMKSRGHNVLVAGATGHAAVGLVRSEIQAIAATRPPPSDWVYVANFEDRHAPRPMKLPPGHARSLASLMDDAIAEMRSGIIATLAGDSYQTRWRAIDAEFQARHQAALSALARTADAHSIALLRTPMGYAVAPAHDGGVVAPEVFGNMPPSMQADVRAQITSLEADLSGLLESTPQVDRQRRARLSKLNREVMSGIVRAALDEPRRMFAGFANVLDFFAAVEMDAVARANDLLPTIDIPDILGADQFAAPERACFEAYRVNAFVVRPPEMDSAPVILEMAPDDAALFGSAAFEGTSSAHHMRLTAGLLHRADGGFLLLDARSLATLPRTWSALLAALSAGAVRPGFRDGGEARGGSTPEPAELDVKIILLSDAGASRQVLADDPRFGALFGVEVAFADRLPRSPETEGEFARVIAGIALDEGLAPLDSAAVAELIELSSRRAGDRDELLLDLSDLTAVARFADDRRAAASRKTISRDDIILAQAALQQHGRKGNRETDASAGFAHQSAAGTVIRLVGGQTGAANQAAAYPGFRQVTARIRQASLKPGEIEVTCIDGAMEERAATAAAERTFEAYLAAEFGHSGAIAVSAALEGACQQMSSENRATCAELLALLSAIAGLPLPQTIAVAGTIDQLGRLRSETGINGAIEEFFDACRANAVTGEAGVVIPAACQSQLMLRQDIVDAAAAGEFTVWAVATAADCFAVLTGLPAATRSDDGSFAEGDAYRLVDEALHKLHRRAAHSKSSGEASP